MALGVTAYSEAPFSADASSVIAYPSGIALTAQENSLSVIKGNANVSVSGQPMVGTTGTLVPVAGAFIDVTGQALTNTLGTTTESIGNSDVPVTGFDLTVANITPQEDTLNAFGEAPFATLSSNTIDGVNVTVEATTGGIVGTFPLPMSLGNVTEITADALVPLTGFPLTMQENTPGAVADVNVSITGFSTPLVLGTAQGFTDVTTEDVTGIGFNINLGSLVTFANANVSATGIAMTMQENAPTVAGDANVIETGFAMTAALGTAVLDANTLVDLTGQAMTMQEGTSTAPDSLAVLTGIPMTITQGTDTNLTIWSEVSRGNAPINPPGWQEVA
jgi:hypothetical protein|tara:strand:- start:562 stop:1560 length:999 start_codon:yes stop_codon:yes gene_type:complete